MRYFQFGWTATPHTRPGVDRFSGEPQPYESYTFRTRIHFGRRGGLLDRAGGRLTTLKSDRAAGSSATWLDRNVAPKPEAQGRSLQERFTLKAAKVAEKIPEDPNLATLAGRPFEAQYETKGGRVKSAGSFGTEDEAALAAAAKMTKARGAWIYDRTDGSRIGLEWDEPDPEGRGGRKPKDGAHLWWWSDPKTDEPG